MKGTRRVVCKNKKSRKQRGGANGFGNDLTQSIFSGAQVISRTADCGPIRQAPSSRKQRGGAGYSPSLTDLIGHKASVINTTPCQRPIHSKWRQRGGSAIPAEVQGVDSPSAILRETDFSSVTSRRRYRQRGGSSHASNIALPMNPAAFSFKAFFPQGPGSTQVPFNEVVAHSSKGCSRRRRRRQRKNRA